MRIVKDFKITFKKICSEIAITSCCSLELAVAVVVCSCSREVKGNSTFTSTLDVVVLDSSLFEVGDKEDEVEDEDNLRLFVAVVE